MNWNDISEEEKSALKIKNDDIGLHEHQGDGELPPNEELKKHPIIQRFEHETGKSLEWIEKKVKVDPVGDESDPDGLGAPSWPVTWPSDELTNDHLHILQAAATLIWVQKDKVTDIQKDSVYDYLKSMEKESIIKNTNRQNAKTSRRKVWADSIAKNLVLKNPDNTFPQLWGMISEDGEYHSGFEVFRDEDRLCADSREKGAESISRETFRIEYIQKARKLL